MKQLQHPQIIIPTLEIIPVDEKGVKKYLGRLELNKTKVIFFGSDLFVIPILQALEDNFEVSAIVTASDSAIACYFKGPIFTSGKLDENFKSQISNFKSDLFIVASYGKIIPKFILNIPKFGALNVHPSLLPKYRGPSPVPATILSGDKVTGVTIIKMDKEMDHGPIVATKEISLTGQENSLFLINKLFQLGADLLVKIIPDYITGKMKLVPQNHAQATYSKRLTRESGYFPIDNPPSPEVLDRMIRAYFPWPGVWTKWSPSRHPEGAQRPKDLKIIKFLPSPRHPELVSGSIKIDSDFRQNDNFLIQMEGKKPISYRDFINGYPDFPLK